MAENNQNQGQGDFRGNNTDAVRLYTEQLSALSLGYWRSNRGEDAGSIRLSPAFEQPQDGKVYNYDKSVSVFFSLNLKDTIKILHGIKQMQKGQISSFMVKHIGNDNSGTILAMGNDMDGYDVYLNIMESDKEGNIVKDLMFNFANDKEDAIDTLLTDVDLSDMSGTPMPLQTDLMMFVKYVESAQSVILKSAQHQPDLMKNGSGGGKGPLDPRNSKVVAPNKQPRERKVTPSGNKNPTVIQPEGGAAGLFEGDDE